MKFFTGTQEMMLSLTVVLTFNIDLIMSGQQPEKDFAMHLALMLMADIAGMFPGKQGCGPKP